MVVNAQLTNYISQLNGNVYKIEDHILYDNYKEIEIVEFDKKGFLTDEKRISCGLRISGDSIVDACDTTSYLISYKFDNQDRIVEVIEKTKFTDDEVEEFDEEMIYHTPIEYGSDFYLIDLQDRIHKYTKNHVLIEKSYQDIELGMASEYFKYTKYGERLLEEESFVSHHEALNDREHITIRDYNSSGLLESINYTSDQTSYIDNYLYDNHQNLIQVNRKTYAPSNPRNVLPTVLYTYEYIYDDNQNWIQQIFIPYNDDGLTPFTIKRKITYY